MKKLTLLSIVTASLLLIGCGQDKAKDTKNEVSTSTKTETIAEKATKAVEATKEVAKEAVAKTAEVAKDAKKAVAEKATKAVKAAKEAVSKAVSSSSAPTAFAKCVGCHGKDGKTKALGKSEIIAGQAKADLVKKIHEYKAGKRNVTGMGGLMKGQVEKLSDADIDAIATYLSGLK